MMDHMASSTGIFLISPEPMPSSRMPAMRFWIVSCVASKSKGGAPWGGP